MKVIYNKNKTAKVGSECICPVCKTEFKKVSYQQVFCGSKGGTICKDKYWNKVTPNKRNNTTRISLASQRWLNDRNLEYSEHPFSSDGLGQWD